MMLPKKPCLLLCSSSSCYSARLSFCYSPSSAGPTSCRPPLAQPTQLQSPPARSYAQHASHPHYDEPDLSWPDPVHPHTTPTPYQILNCRRGDAYTKHRFYHLVKLYHPDRCSASSPAARLPDATRLERYRLLVAAHTILADDAKRRAYDAWGHGWAGHHRTPSHTSAYTWAPEQKQWPAGHDPMHNATWEDWERWYERESGASGNDPRDMYMSNFAIVSLLCALIPLGLVMQGTRANMFSSSVMEHRDKMHKEASLELARSKRATISGGDRDERIRTFLEHREAVLAGEDAYQRILPPAETRTPASTVRKE